MQIIDLHFLGNDRAISTFLITTTAGKVLVECGPYSTYPTLVKALTEHQTSPEEIKAVFLTHIHFDHAGAAWAFAKLGALIYVHPAGAGHLAQPERLYNSARMIYGNRMDTLWGEMQPIDPELIIQPAHQEVIKMGEHTFTALHTPGHASHHIAWGMQVVSSNQKELFTGDAAGVTIDGGPVQPPCPPPDINIEDWKKSIQIMRDFEPDLLHLTHYGTVNEPIKHLQDLEDQLVAWSQWILPYFEAQTPQDCTAF
jgi:glyoxylase-like metal-dependent hydrolase (beta-lactamase superfamily II)